MTLGLLTRGITLRILIVLFVTWTCTWGLLVKGNEKVVQLAVSTYPDPSSLEKPLQVTLETLRRAVYPSTLKVTYLDVADLAKFIESKQANLVILPAGQYRRMQQLGLRDIASLITKGFSDQNQCDGGVIVAKASRSDLKDIQSLYGKVLAANTPSGFNGFAVQMGEIYHRGFDPDHFFKKIIFTGENIQMQNVARLVNEGKADVGFLKMCLLEQLEKNHVIPKGALKIISEYKDQAGKYPCGRSTELYPSWVIATTPHASPELSRLVTQTILNTNTEKDGFQWDLATNFTRIDQLYRDLKLGPYAYLREWNFSVFWEKYRQYFYILALITVLLCSHYLYALLQVNIRTWQLKQAMKQQKETEIEKLRILERVSSLQRAFEISQLSSLFVHELGQPLNAIFCFSLGLKTRREAGGPVSEEETQLVLEKILTQTERARNVVNRARDYIKGSGRRNALLNLSSILENLVKHLVPREKINLKSSIQDGCYMRGDLLELEIIFQNLLKNSVEAAGRVNKPMVSVSLKRNKANLMVVIKNNGELLSEKALQQMKAPLFTTKPDGIGLGLSIVIQLIESYKGNIDFVSNKEGGITVTVSFMRCLNNEWQKLNSSRG